MMAFSTETQLGLTALHCLHVIQSILYARMAYLQVGLEIGIIYTTITTSFILSRKNIRV